MWQLQAFDPSVSGGSNGDDDDDIGGGGDQTGDELALCYPKSGTTKNVSSASQLSSALSSASPGDHIVVASGSYGGNITMNRSGTAENPIVIKAASTSNRPRFTGRITINGDYTVFEGLEFTGSGGFVVFGKRNRITRNYIHNFTGSAIRIEEGDFNRVDHNEIADQAGRGHGLHNLSVYGADDNRFDHNYLHDLPDQDQNGNEPIYTGHSGGTAQVVIRPSRILIDHNLLVRARAEGEVIGIKSSAVRVIANTSIDSDGYFSNRVGDKNEWRNNWIEGSDLRVYGRDTKIIGNHVVGGAIHLLKGSATIDNFRSPEANDPVAENTLVVGNSGGSIVLGEKYGAPLPVRNTRLEANQSTVRKVSHVGTTESNTASVSVGTAKKLTTSEVGLNAPDPSCQ
jgi:hypothetical protein